MSKILVTGAAGQFGRLVLDELLASGQVAPADIVAASRDPAKLAAYGEKGVTLRKADFDDAATLDAAFQGIDKALIISTDALAVPGQRLSQHKNAVTAAKKAGVGRVFYTSLPNAATSAVSFAPDHLGTEEAIKATGLPYTILRNSWYMENLFLSVPTALQSGTWYTSAGDGKTSYVARADLAAATAAALLGDRTGNETLTLTGPVAYTNAEIADLVSEISGRPLAVVNLTDEQLAGGMEAAGVPAFLVPTLVSFDANARLGHIEIVTDSVETLTGRPSKNLRAFLEENKAALAG
ncbi:NAD(P)-dependent oxidoreductase [Rhizobium sp. Leaf371]|uniref:SDR family oxidoreductase n=1 Tax=Rhizobium sp. Leaf371 TaxID=1736355 RepID=UPI000713CFE6|nr:SDR family oxidoreductase [Rhizobium sp. Leaf371]KQS72691.1 NAD(P)-dependent oxidoreductase [Rhizobium sp. Leaf371]